jgi:uncharacterized protein (UPF0218 family)
MSAANAMRLQIAKIGTKLFDMSLCAIGAVTQTRSVDTVGDLVGKN